MNKTFFIGNLTRKPEEFKTANDKTICKFTIAVNRDYTIDGNKVTDYFPVIAYNKLAEVLLKYLDKGKRVAVLGTLENRSYEDKDGIKRTVTEIKASDIEFLSPSGTSTDKEENEPKRAILEAIDDNQLPF